MEILSVEQVVFVLTESILQVRLQTEDLKKKKFR